MLLHLDMSIPERSKPQRPGSKTLSSIYIISHCPVLIVMCTRSMMSKTEGLWPMLLFRFLQKFCDSDYPVSLTLNFGEHLL